MNQGKLVFAQITEHLPLTTFRRCVARYAGTYKVKSFSCLDQYLSMAFAQLTYRESLRDIEACLRAQQQKLYHMGIKSRVSRSTLADANESRDWRIYADFAQSLIAIARRLYATEPFGVDLRDTVYALDASTIDLCLSVFPWAPFRSTKAAIKLHTLLDLRGNIPSFLHISDGKLHDVSVLDLLLPEPGAFYIMDRGYIDFDRLFQLHEAKSFFVTRAKSNLKAQRRYSHPVDRSTGLICDQTIVLTGFYSKQDFDTPLRRVRFKDPATGKRLVFLTNNFTLPAFTITELYRCRWQVELFFKWIKQHLRIKVFFGTSENAVKTQIWIAVSVYVLVAIVKKRLNIAASLYEILQILSLTMFERIPLDRLLNKIVADDIQSLSSNQLNLFH
jgi:IS4 transposase